MQSALIVGESVMDVIVRDGRIQKEAPGGSPLNVAVALSRLGLHVDFATALGSDTYGARIGAHLAGSGVNVMPASAAGVRTSVATAKLGPDGSADYEFDITWDIGKVASSEAQIVHVGSLGLFLEPGATQVDRLLARHEGRALISIDPNIRPSLLPNADVTRQHFEGLCTFADVVKLSCEDAEWLYPRLSTEEVIGRLIALGVHIVCVTDGSEGSVLASSARRVRVPSVPAKVVDTIGAGDAYMAGLLFHIAEREQGIELRRASPISDASLRDMGLFATRVASKTVSRPGADPPWSHELS